MVLMLLAPLILPVLHIVTLLTLPATALYAVAGLLSTPLMIPILIIKNIVSLVLMSPFYLLALPVALPVGFVLGVLCLIKEGLCSLFFLATVWLLWPVYLFCKVCKFTCTVASVIVTDTVMPWLVPIRFVVLTALFPKLVMSA